jgi:hypothetical protein
MVIDVVVLYFNNNNTTHNSTNHCRIVSILRMSILRDWLYLSSFNKVNSNLSLENDIFVIFDL